MSPLRVGIPTALASLVLASATLAQDYDLVINNGRVMDPETMFDGFARNTSLRARTGKRNW